MVPERYSFYLKQKDWQGPLLLSLFFFFLTFLFGLEHPTYLFEEAAKISFLNYFETPLQLLPGNHQPRDFYGHPGLHQALLYFWTKFFGLDLFNIRLFNALISCFAGIGAYFLAKQMIHSKQIALVTALSLVFLPVYFEYSTLFYQDIIAFGLVCFSLVFYFRNKIPLSLISQCLGILCLESAIAVTFIILFWAIKYREPFKNILLYSLPIWVLSLFFLWEFLATNSFSHAVLVNDWSRFQLLSLQRVVNNLSRISLSFYYNFHLLILLAFGFIFYKGKRKPISFETKILLGIGIQYFVFYIFFNFLPSARDFIFIYFLLILYSFSYLFTFKARRRNSLILFLFIFFSSSYLNYVNKMEILPMTGYFDSLKQVNRLIKKHQTYPVLYQTLVQDLFANPLYGYTNSNFQTTNEAHKVNTLVSFPPSITINPVFKENLNSEFQIVEEIGDLKIYIKKGPQKKEGLHAL